MSLIILYTPEALDNLSKPKGFIKILVEVIFSKPDTGNSLDTLPLSGTTKTSEYFSSNNNPISSTYLSMDNNGNNPGQGSAVVPPVAPTPIVPPVNNFTGTGEIFAGRVVGTNRDTPFVNDGHYTNQEAQHMGRFVENNQYHHIGVIFNSGYRLSSLGVNASINFGDLVDNVNNCNQEANERVSHATGTRLPAINEVRRRQSQLSNALYAMVGNNTNSRPTEAELSSCLNYVGRHSDYMLTTPFNRNDRSFNNLRAAQQLLNYHEADICKKIS